MCVRVCCLGRAGLFLLFYNMRSRVLLTHFVKKVRSVFFYDSLAFLLSVQWDLFILFLSKTGSLCLVLLVLNIFKWHSKQRIVHDWSNLCRSERSVLAKIIHQYLFLLSYCTIWLKYCNYYFKFFVLDNNLNNFEYYLFETPVLGVGHTYMPN